MAKPIDDNSVALDDFDVLDDGDVIVFVNDGGDGYSHSGVIPAAILAEIAAKSRAQTEIVAQAETTKRHTVDYFYARPKL